MPTTLPTSASTTAFAGATVGRGWRRRRALKFKTAGHVAGEDVVNRRAPEEVWGVAVEEGVLKKILARDETESQAQLSSGDINSSPEEAVGSWRRRGETVGMPSAWRGTTTASPSATRIVA